MLVGKIRTTMTTEIDQTFYLGIVLPYDDVLAIGVEFWVAGIFLGLADTKLGTE